MKADKLNFSYSSSSLGREANVGMVELESILYQAQKSLDSPKVQKITERVILYELGWFEVEKAAYAFIDMKRRRVIGFRFFLRNDGNTSSGRWLVDVKSLLDPTKKKSSQPTGQDSSAAQPNTQQEAAVTASVAVPVTQSPTITAAPSSSASSSSSSSGSAPRTAVKQAYFCKPCSMNLTIGGRCARCPQMKSQTPAQYCSSCVPVAGLPMNCLKCTKPLGPIAPGKSYPQDQAAHLCNICSMGPKKSMCIKCQKLIL
eukprot:TRINITY_DN712_c0_g1_i1.p1 TRINITY_DN712_c0_g1~~TRINITY_DN712_c0_g1_i1.p1  ORF type:complete len:258 (-),score=42.19 TRINITY_DN712_c0_g1_i1:152-925(-)